MPDTGEGESRDSIQGNPCSDKQRITRWRLTATLLRKILFKG